MKIKKLILLQFVILALTLQYCKSKTDTDEIIETPITGIPILVTNQATDITIYNFSISGAVIDPGDSDLSEIGFVSGLSPNPTVEENFSKAEKDIANADLFNAFYIQILPDTVFYIRAYGINANGVGYGNEVEVRTPKDKRYIGSVTLSTQEEVEAFGLENYTSISSQLRIEGTVNDLTPLLGLVEIGESLKVQNTTSLVNFKGLDSLRTIGSILPNGVLMQNNQALENFAGLENLFLISGSTQIKDNPQLINFEGLNKLEIIGWGGLFWIGNNDNLINLNGLEGLKYLTDNLEIIGNEKLNDISALSNLEILSGRLNIWENATLPNLDGLENITKVEAIDLLSNQNLSDISGLSNIESPLEVLRIYESDNLLDLQPLEKINLVDNLTLSGNSNLSDLSGLRNITNLKYLNVRENNALETLNDLENLTAISNIIDIEDNPNLFDFCSLKTSLQSNIPIAFSISGNQSNPTVQEIIDNCQ